MASPCYTVPDAVTFRNIAVLKDGQTRTLLVKNTSSAPCTAHVSKPFTPCFELSLPAQQPHSWQDPDTLELTVPANDSAKVVVSLRLPLDIPRNENIQDRLVVVMGGDVLLVPIQAVAQALDPASGAALQALIAGLSFWPPQHKLDSMAAAWAQSLGARLGAQIVLPMSGLQEQHFVQQRPPVAQSVSPSSGDSVIPLRPPSAQLYRRPASGGVGQSALRAGQGHINPAVINAVAGILGEGDLQPHVSGASVSTPLRAPAAELPPDTFSVQPADDDDKASVMSAFQPYTLIKPVVVQGRTAYAVGAAPSSVDASTSTATAVTSTGVCHVQTGSSGRPSRGRMNASGAGEPGGRRSAGSSRPMSSSTAAEAVNTAGNAAVRVAFVIDGRAYDARGREVASVGEAGDMLRFTHTLIDCSKGARLHKSGSFGRMTDQLIESLGLPPATPPTTSSCAPAAQVTGGRPQALVPLPHKPALHPVPQQVSARGLDPAREAALAAAMREFGISNLPAPPAAVAAVSAPAIRQPPPLPTPTNNASPLKPLVRIPSAGSGSISAQPPLKQLPPSMTSPVRQPHSLTAATPAASQAVQQLTHISSQGRRDVTPMSTAALDASPQRASPQRAAPVVVTSLNLRANASPHSRKPAAVASAPDPGPALPAPAQAKVQNKAVDEDGDEDLERTFEERLMMSISMASSSAASSKSSSLDASSGNRFGASAAKRRSRPPAASSLKPGASMLKGSDGARSVEGGEDDDGNVHDSFRDDVSDAINSAIERQMAAELEREGHGLQANRAQQQAPKPAQQTGSMAAKAFSMSSSQSATAPVRKSLPPAVKTRAAASQRVPVAPTQLAKPKATKATMSPAAKAEQRRMQDAWDAL